MIPIRPVSQLRTEKGEVGKPHFETLPPLSLYIHFPWCVRKCPYCDFYSHEKGSNLPEAEYLEVLLSDLEASLPLVWGRSVSSIFIGGGTPSLLSAGGIDRLLSSVRVLLPVLPDAEISMEANPGTFESGKFKSYRESGINRLSIGIQSFNSRHLHQLGRIHDSDEAKDAIAIAMKYFDNVNLDLMIALPKQTLDELEQDISTALSFQTPHLSLYQLTIEPNTYFAKHPPVLPDEDVIERMQSRVEEMTEQAGFEHYEVSAYAKAGHQCRHNKNYWLFGDYLGIGAAAHSKLTVNDEIIRQMRHRNPKLYMEGDENRSRIEEQFVVQSSDVGFEFMLNALRFTGGFPASLFCGRTGLPMSSILEPLEKARKKGLLAVNSSFIRPTELGKRFLNDLQQIFLPD